MVKLTLDSFSKIDILVNNAAISRSMPTVELPESEWDAHININLKGQFLCSQAVGREMLKQKRGKIINISSVSGHRGVPAFVAYSASKDGVHALTRSLAIEWARYNINVNSVSPGMTMTEMMDGLMKQAPDMLRERVKRIPLKRPNQPEDIAKAVLFLASSESDNIIGQDIIVDGGCHALHGGITLPES